MALPLVVGCQGCRPEAETDPKDPQGPKEPFTFSPARPFPRGEQPADDRIKPGHWTTASVTLRSNQGDSRGRLYADTRLRRTASSTQTDPPIQNGSLTSVRPVVMPKGQRRRFDFRVLPPSVGSNSRGRCYIDNQFVADASSVFELGSGPVATLPSEEYFLVVLTTRPERFAKLRDADWTRPPRQDEEFTKHVGNYRVVIPPSDDLLPLSDTALDWTSTSVVLWDDLPPEGLTPDQLRAMRDWMHFGGRLIVNGANAAEAIDDTLLADFLPVRPSGNIELDPDQASEMLQHWSVEGDNTTGKQTALLNSESARVALDGRVSKSATEAEGTSGLVYRRTAGRGTVVQARFDVTNRWFSDWRSWDSFFNAVMLERPRRGYVVRDQSALAVEFKLVNQIYVDLESPQATAAMNTDVRLLARDAVLPQDFSGNRDLGDNQDSETTSTAPRDSTVTRDDGRYRQHAGGLAAWTDSSDVMRLCTEILRDESGIEIPESSLVVRSLGWYLLALVPLNYLVFRLMGRPEYAWLAVPVIAIGGAIWVARAARLDIGFARSINQVALLEVPREYDRGHLCRVGAIYNSLSSTYGFAFDDVNAASVAIGGPSDSRTGGRSAIEFRTSFAEGPAMGGLQIASNEVRMVHAEQIVDLGGGLTLEDGQLINQTDHELLDTVVVRRDAEGDFEVAVVGVSSPQSSQTLRFKSSSRVSISGDLPMSVHRLMRPLASPSVILPGESRLVGRIDGGLAGMAVSPLAGQSQEQTVVVAHLESPPPPQPAKDQSLPPLRKREP